MKPNDEAYKEFMRVYNKTHVSLEAQIMASLTAAYAAQFKSEDYAGLVKQLRFIDEDTLNIEPYSCEQLCKNAADALEAVLAERDALKAERDALAARLAPVEDEALMEIARQTIIKETGGRWGLWPGTLAAVISAIRPHIEAAERERCAKIADKYVGEWHSDLADGCARSIAAAIRSGK